MRLLGYHPVRSRLGTTPDPVPAHRCAQAAPCRWLPRPAACRRAPRRDERPGPAGVACGACMTVHNSVLELIGDTPMVKAQRLDTGVCELFLKLESANPGGSIKDRIGLSMIEGAEKAGKLQPGATLVEGTAGNTGLGL